MGNHSVSCSIPRQFALTNLLPQLRQLSRLHARGATDSRLVWLAASPRGPPGQITVSTSSIAWSLLLLKVCSMLFEKPRKKDLEMITIRSSLPSKTNIQVRGKSDEKRTTAVRVCELYQTTPGNLSPRANKGKDQLVFPGINVLRNDVWASARHSVSPAHSSRAAEFALCS